MKLLNKIKSLFRKPYINYDSAEYFSQLMDQHKIIHFYTPVRVGVALPLKPTEGATYSGLSSLRSM